MCLGCDCQRVLVEAQAITRNVVLDKQRPSTQSRLAVEYIQAIGRIVVGPECTGREIVWVRVYWCGSILVKEDRALEAATEIARIKGRKVIRRNDLRAEEGVVADERETGTCRAGQCELGLIVEWGTGAQLPALRNEKIVVALGKRDGDVHIGDDP